LSVQPTPKSLILDLLSTVRGQAMPVRALVAAGEVFAISSESMRVALARLLRRGTIERNERGQYRIAPAAQAIERHVGGWTRAEERVAAWRPGSWIAVHTAGLQRSDRTQVRRRQRTLQFLGVRELSEHLWVRPNNLKGGVEAARAELFSLGLEREAPVFELTHLEPGIEARARALWDTTALRRQYTSLRAALERSSARLSQLAPAAAMAESFLLGGQVLRQIVLDPLLPEPMIPVAERRALSESMRRYDQLGRACWRPFMQAHDAPHLQTPRTLQAAQAWTASA
jgi:phenylacetic acid degradation operon negative regulatory protein